MAYFQKFCFCGRIELGGYVIGALEIIHTLYLMIISMTLLNNLSEVFPKDEDLGFSKIYIKIVLVLLITICIVNLGTSTMLIYGTYKRIPSYLFAWLVSGMISIVVLLLNTFAYNQPATYLFDAGLKFYWWFCVLSLYEIFKQEALQPPPEESTMSMVQCSDDKEPNPDYASIP